MRGTGTTRIDVALANFRARHIIHDLRHLYEVAVGYDHLPLEVTIDTALFTQKIKALKTSAN